MCPQILADNEALVDEQDIALTQLLRDDSGLEDRLSEGREPEETVYGVSVCGTGIDCCHSSGRQHSHRLRRTRDFPQPAAPMTTWK